MTEPQAADDPRVGDRGFGPASTGPEPDPTPTPEASTEAAGATPAEGPAAEAGKVVDSEATVKASAASKQDGPQRPEAEQATPIVIRDRRRVSATGTRAGQAAGTQTPKSDAGEAASGEAASGEATSAADATAPAADAAATTATEPAAPGEAPAPEETASAESDATGGLGAELEALRAELEERTKDLQRLSAEYANYRKRVERDRALVAEQATGAALSALLPVLDDLDRAREHGDLVGSFGAVAEHLLSIVSKLGLTAFGEKGDPFDPTRHEAVAHHTSSEVTAPTCVEIMRRGYLLGDKLLRPALVAVADPE